MKLNNLLQIRKILNQHGQDKMSTGLAYKIMKFLKNTESEETFYNNKIQELLLTYGEKDTNGQLVQENGGIKIIQDKIQECNAAAAEIANTEVEVPATKLTLEELEPLGLTVSDLYILDDIITE